MSTKGAAAKDLCLLPSKGIQDHQFKSINLNHHKKFDGNVKVLQSETISKENPKSTGFVDYNSSSGKNISNFWKKNGILTSLSKSFIQECNKQEKEENKWQNKSEMNKSTLSLHIAAYENGIESQNVDRSLGKGFEQETFASKTLKNAFNFPRQFQESMKPEMMQFKTSQKLMNFNAFSDKMLVPKIITFSSHRTRATYHQTKRTWMPKFVRRFFLQYPKAPAYMVVGFATYALFHNLVDHTYKKLTLSKEEFAIYAEHFNEVTRARQKFGHDLYFPFFNDNKAILPMEKPKPE